MLGVQYLLPIHKQKQFTWSVTLGAIVNLILNVPLIKLWGLNGAMWSTVLSEVSVTLYQLWAVKNLLSFKELFTDSWKYFISGLSMFIVVFWMNTHLKDTWIMLGGEVLIGVLIYTILIIILKAKIIDQLKELVGNKLKRE